MLSTLSWKTYAKGVGSILASYIGVRLLEQVENFLRRILTQLPLTLDTASLGMIGLVLIVVASILAFSVAQDVYKHLKIKRQPAIYKRPEWIPPSPTRRLDETDRVQYMTQLKHELILLGQELENVEHPSLVSYPVWLCSHDSALRLRLIGSQEINDIIQRFYTALEERYNYQKTMLRPDDKFVELNTRCKEAYDVVMKSVPFPT